MPDNTRHRVLAVISRPTEPNPAQRLSQVETPRASRWLNVNHNAESEPILFSASSCALVVELPDVATIHP